MSTVARQLLAIAALPFVVTVVVPLWIARRGGVAFSPGRGALALGTQLAGVALLLVGLALFTTSLARFVRVGKGTLAPWDPPRHIVVDGPYRYVRNPMISGVVLILLGEAALLRSTAHLAWAGIFFLINAIFIPLWEEPVLARRFGESYRDYCRHVPRLVPRLRPWRPPDAGDR